ncbi:MAG: nucleoside triphosphate pyrophosphohydrolase [Capsulimonas sp.]|nr:nucleoside triphosphate pyrophosphohydrolase [Capsulimonas sp.]
MTLTVIGLGDGRRDSLTLGALDALRQAGARRFARTRSLPAIGWLESPEGGVVFDAAFDSVPAGASDERASAIIIPILEAAREGDAVYAVPGDPLLDENASLHLWTQARAEGIAVRVIRLARRAEDDARYGFDALVALMARLRNPDGGCPWDLEQTSRTIRRHVIEEAYEVAEAIDSGAPEKLSEELGDLMLQVVFHAQMASELGEFSVDDVTQAIVEKLVRRHPHVFGSVSVANSEDVLTNWDAIKRKEKGNEDRTSILDGIPKDLPALMRALEVSKRVVKVGFEWPTVLEVLDKVDEEIAELRAEIAIGDTARAGEELGDLLFTLVNVARQLKVDPEEALRNMTLRFANRFRYIERHAEAEGRRLQDLSLDEMETVWAQAKREQ